jgi:hypothetical protein
MNYAILSNISPQQHLATQNYAILSSNSPQQHLATYELCDFIEHLTSTAPCHTKLCDFIEQLARQFLRAVGLFALYFLRLKSSAGNGNPAELFI